MTKILTGFILPLFGIGAIAAEIDFDREIRPILSENCFHCHGPDSKKRKADLRLDTRAGALADHKGLRAVVPFKADESEMIRRLLENDPDERMPPPKSKLSVAPEDIEKVRQWINDGAEWAQHWAFEPIRNPVVPGGERHPIDAFLGRRLKQEQLSFSPQAAPESLIRRVTLDLTGLPPTPEEVADFVNNAADNRYVALVDRLLASPRYGERMAWDWLEAARYADTDGFQKDPTRNMWPWRDWLVKALNTNMPFDQFTIEMLAGDLLSSATLEQKLATAFNRNHTFNGEGGRIPEETRVENVMDRNETTSTIWMGLTMTCARCHDHKYDPITQKEYYQLYAFFNNTSETGKGGSGAAEPTLSYQAPKNDQPREEISVQRSAVQAELETADPALDAAQAAWEASVLEDPSAGLWQVLHATQLTADSGVELESLDDFSFRANGENPPKDRYEILARTEEHEIRTLRFEALQDMRHPFEGVGRDEKGNFVLSEFDFLVKPTGTAETSYQRMDFSFFEADHEQNGYTLASALDKNPQTQGWAVDGHVNRVPRAAIFQLKEPAESTTGFDIKIVMTFHSKHAFHNLARGRFTISRELLKLGDIRAALDPSWAHLVSLGENRTAEQSKLLRAAYRKTFSAKAVERKAKLAERKNKQEEVLKSTPAVQVMVMDELPEAKLRKTFVLNVGTYDKPTDIQVSAETPAWLPALPADAPRNRLTFARWLVSPEHPLTARVTVNRYWQQLFGRGLVSTPEDFGSQGAKPEHPALLDWLAYHFVHEGWDVKAMHRLMVTSKAYRQSARVTASLLEKDPENLLLARAPRHRLPSWMLRDQALSVSGLLNASMGGPGVKPYQPPGMWKEATFGKIAYTPDSGDQVYRRSLYVFWRRIVGPPMFFNAAKRQTCQVKVTRTNTPLHALTTLNEPLFVESARAMAERVLKREPGQRIEYAIQLVTARKPDAVEHTFLKERLAEFVLMFSQDASAAPKLLATGNSPADTSIDATEHAAWTLLCSTLLNLDETQNKE